MEFDGELLPGDVVVEEADQLVANKMMDQISKSIVRNGSLWTKKTASSLQKIREQQARD